MDFKSALSGLGTVLTGTSMGMQGRGAEFAQGLAAQDEAERQRRAKAQQDMLQGRAVTSRVVLQSLKAGQPDQAFQFLSNVISEGRASGDLQGEDLQDALSLASMIHGGQYKEAIDILTPMDKQFQLQGLLPEMAQPKEDKVLLESRKELRGDLRKRTNSINEEVSVINTNYGKLKGLAEQVRKGNRSAVSQMLVSLVKLGDPTSVVKETEMEAALNAENPVAALVSKGVDSSVAESILKRIDPLNPETVNVDEVLSTGRSLIAANAPDIMERYEGVKKRGQEFLSDTGYNSVFGGNLDARVSKLKEFIPIIPNHPQYGDITEEDIKETMLQNNMTRQQVMQGLGIK